MATSLCSSLTARPDFIPADASSSASHDDVENCHTSVTHKRFLLSWKIFEDTHPGDHLALCTEGESVCVQERLCSTGTAISRGHVIWPIDLATIPADASHVHFRYVSGLTGHTLAQSQSLPLQSITRSTSLNVPVSRSAVEGPSTDQSAAGGTLSESPADQSGVCGPFLESSSGLAADATVEKSEMVTCESPGDHHYSPLWLKTTGESIYRFDGNSEPIYETLYPVAAGTGFGETPPPLPPRNTGGGSVGNLHKPLTRSKALHYSNWSRESDNDDMEAEDSTPPPPPRSRNDSGETRVAEPLEEPPLIPARKPQAHLTPPVIPKRMNAASPELPPRGKRHGSVSPSRTTERRPVTRTAEAASRLPSIATLPLRSKYQKAELPPEEESLPAMWEARVDIHGRVFYVDHNTRTTSWVRPQQTSTSSSVSSASGLNDVSRQQLDRRYQSIRRTINRQRRREEHDSSPSPAAQQQPETSPATDETPPANLLDSPALQFVTRPDFFALLHSNEEATQLYNRSPAVRQLLARLWRNPTSFQRYQHNRDLVSLLNLFADTSRSLPGNWETRQDKHGRTFYIDHQHKTTTYIDPRLPKLSESIQLAAAAAAAASGASSTSAETSMEADDEADAGGTEPAAPQTPPRAPAPPPRPPTSHSGRSSPVNASEVPTAYNEKVVAFLRQPNVHDILRERHPELSRNARLRDKVNGVRVDGTSALERWSHDVELTILLSLFENEIMSYVPPLLSSAAEPVAPAAALNGRSTPQLSPHSSPAPMRQVRNPVRHGKRDFEAKLRHFYRKLESKGYGQGPSKFKMSIRRDHLLEDAYVKIMSASKKDLQKAKLHISFAGEDGLDYGGPSREFFFLLSREVFNPYYGLFEYSANDTYTVQISPMSAFVDNYNEWFRFCGRILGLALVHQYLLDVFFTRPFYKALLRLPVSLSDLESLDAEFHQSLLWLRDNNLNTVGTDLELSFSVMEEVGGKLEERELKPGGKNIPVTEKNKKEYLERMVRWRLDRGVTEQNEALLRGFSEVLEPRYVAIFDARELELVLAGTADIDVSDWRKNTEYRSGYHDGHQVVQWFWSAIEKFSNEQRLRLLQFVTGTSSIPYEGFAALRGSTGPRKFCIEKWGQPDSLPRAHTCFNRLDLPPYENADTLYEKLLLAVEETSTFGIE